MFGGKRKEESRKVVLDHTAGLIARSVDLSDFEMTKYGGIREQLKESTLIDGRILPKVATIQGLSLIHI